MKRILAIAASIVLVFAMTSCNNQTSMEKKTTPNPENAARAQQFIKEAGSTYYLATAETNGQAHVRPFGTAEIFEGKLYIQTGKVKNVYKQLAANPKAELCCYNAATGQWIRICGDLIPDERTLHSRACTRLTTTTPSSSISRTQPLPSAHSPVKWTSSSSKKEVPRFFHRAWKNIYKKHYWYSKPAAPSDRHGGLLPSDRMSWPHSCLSCGFRDGIRHALSNP